ncbi:hypothetical protein ACFLTH_10390 [Bacteroidota bacterium]
MDLYAILVIIVFILVLLALGGVLWFINWLSNKIDKKDRLGKQGETKKNSP